MPCVTSGADQQETEVEAEFGWVLGGQLRQGPCKKKAKDPRKWGNRPAAFLLQSLRVYCGLIAPFLALANCLSTKHLSRALALSGFKFFMWTRRTPLPLPMLHSVSGSSSTHLTPLLP
jgi:hypothetical protein